MVGIQLVKEVITEAMVEVQEEQLRGDRTGYTSDITGTSVVYAEGGYGNSNGANGTSNIGNGGNGIFCGGRAVLW